MPSDHDTLYAEGMRQRDAIIHGLRSSLVEADKALRKGGALLLEMSAVAQAIEDIGRELASLPMTGTQRQVFAEIYAAIGHSDVARWLLERTLCNDAPGPIAASPKASGVICPCCHGQFPCFLPFGVTTQRPNARCPNCGALERHRLMQLYFERRTNLFSAAHRVLHFAPEACFAKVLEKHPLISYVSADLYAPGAQQRIDITDIPYPDDSFDVILCSHVLEHVPDDHRAMRELRRVLRPRGWALLQVPIDSRRAVTFEDPTVTDPLERERLFGQHDHVRWYGRDYAARLASSGFQVRVDDFVGEFSPELVRQYGLMAGEAMHVCTKSPSIERHV